MVRPATPESNVICVELNRLDLAEGAPTMSIDPYDYTLTGDVTNRFKPRELPF